MRTCSKTPKYLIAHNFFNFDHNIVMLPLIFHHIDERNPTEEEFFKLELPSSHNYLKWSKIIDMLHLIILIFMSEIQIWVTQFS